MGLLDPNQMLNPQTQGLLGLGQGLLQSSGWSPTPISMGQAMGQGLKSGLSAYTGAQQQQLENQLAQQKLGQGPKPTSLMQNLQAGGLAPGSPEYQAKMLEAVMKPSTQIDLNQGGFKVPAGYMLDPANPDGGVTPIPGGPQDPKIKLRNDYNKSMDTIGRMSDAFNTYRTELSKHGTKLVPGKAHATLSGAHKNLLLETKELFKLGVLAGPDMDLMEAVLMDPTSIKGNFYEMVGGREAFDATKKGLIND